MKEKFPPQKPVYVSRPYIPPLQEYTKLLHEVWESGFFTNNAPLVQRLEKSLQSYLGIPNTLFCSNGTIVLMMAQRYYDLFDAEIITSPFTYVATASSILWERNLPVFADILPDSLTLDPQKIEEAITPRTKAILPVHVFGYPCEVDAIEAIGKKYNIPVIYDAAHAFGCFLDAKSLLAYGDISTCSFHATKFFHTAEGGAICLNSPELHLQRLSLLRSFGHLQDEHIQLGINGKNSELHAAMGLCILPHIPDIVEARQKIFEVYDSFLLGKIQMPRYAGSKNFCYNYGYYPVLLPNESIVLDLCSTMQKMNIFPRRYFYPSLNTLPYLGETSRQSCPVSEDAARRVLCLPIYHNLGFDIPEKIARIFLQYI